MATLQAVLFSFFITLCTTSTALSAPIEQSNAGKKHALKKHTKPLVKKSSLDRKQPNKKVLSKAGQHAHIPPAKKLSKKNIVQSLSNVKAIATTPKLMKGESEDPLKALSSTLAHNNPPRPSQSIQKNNTDDDDLSDDDDNETHDEEDSDDDDGDTNPDEEKQESSPAPLNKKIMIRVLLKEFSTEQRVTFALQSNRGFVLESPIASGKRARWKHEVLNLLAFKHNIFLLTGDGIYKRIKSNEVAIASIGGNLKLDNYSYSGTMHIRIDPKTKMVQIINKVNLDDYIYAVLRYESLSHWPLEMQKVQAIASRTYAVRQIKLTRSKNANQSFYDIKNNNSHQVYNGTHDSVHLRQAVNETHNLILTYNGDIALTMFDICCGGIIPGYMKKRDADKPYLFRKNRCTYCHDKANFEWNCSFDKNTFLSRMLENPKLASKAKKIGKITGISIKEKDRAGIIHRILIHGSKHNISFTNNEFKSALGVRAKSNAYVVKKLQDDIVVHGYGFGHNMGLCQIGARELVSRDWDYQEILDFYFPKTKLMRLKVI